MARFVNFLILLCMSLYLTNLAFEDGSSASLLLPQSFSQASSAADLSHDGSFPFTINVNEAEELISLLPAIKEFHTKGIEVKWDAQLVPTKNNGDYYFFRIYNVTAPGADDTGSTSVGNYAVNKHTADVRVSQISDKVSLGDDGDFVTTNEIERLQEKLRRSHGIDFKIIREFRSAHLARRIAPAQIGSSNDAQHEFGDLQEINLTETGRGD